ncbi:bladder cancer-associated protein, partial [Daubentonia madagascariensis]
CIASSGCCLSSSSPSPSTPPCGLATPCSWASTCSASSWSGNLAQFVPWFSWQPCSSSAIAAGGNCFLYHCSDSPLPESAHDPGVVGT